MTYKKTIGIAEDHDQLRLALKRKLTDNNFEVVLEATDGDDLMKQIENASEKPVICIVDANMPVMDGITTVSKLKKEYPDIKIIAFSDDKVKGFKMLREGADDYLPKQQTEFLVEYIEKMLERIVYCRRKRK